MIIRNATLTDLDIIITYDKWISRGELKKKIEDELVYVAYENDEFIGWLRYGLFWDNTPFMNMLYLLKQYHGKGIGKQFVEFWETEMIVKGYKVFLTSSAQNEFAQHFYENLGYKAIGSFTLSNDPLEIIFAKTI